jgi:hypothetical protein
MPVLDDYRVYTDTVVICQRLDEIIALLREQMGKPQPLKDEAIETIGPLLNDSGALYYMRRVPDAEES